MAFWRRRMSDLPEEVLELVFKRPTMEPIDLLRCRDVCRSWNSVVMKLFGDQLQPMLPAVLYVPGNYTFSVNTPPVYKLRDHYGKSSCRGWILLIDKTTSDITLFNPLSKFEILLPKVNPALTSTNNEVTFSLSSSPSSDPDHCVILLKFQLQIGHKFAYHRLGGLKWRVIKTAANWYEDMVCYKGKFYTVDDWDQDWIALIHFELRENPPRAYRVLLKFDDRVEPPPWGSSKYIVVLPNPNSSGYDLLMVARCRVGGVSGGMTASFRVFKLDWCNKIWREVTTFGNNQELALFLGHNDSFFVSAHDRAECKPNCIYFVDDMNNEPFGYTITGADLGVFDLETGRIDPFYNSPFNRWFVPDVGGFDKKLFKTTTCQEMQSRKLVRIRYLFGRFELAQEDDSCL